MLYFTCVIGLFLLSYLILLIRETIKLKRNPRPKMVDTCSLRFKNVSKIKTHNYGVIESR